MTDQARTQTTGTPAYRNPTLPVTQRVADLLAQMTLEEKIAQLGSVYIFELLSNQQYDAAKADARLGQGIGQITRLAGASSLEPAACARLANQVQRYLVEQTRLGIPAMIHEECCSGYTARSATSFPQIIGLASTWMPELVEAMTQVIREQMRAVGAHQGLAPVLDVGRDPRFGRIEETFGEDPYLISRMGVAYIRGLQGDNLAEGIAATAKHFVGYSVAEAGLNWAPAHIPPRALREVYLAPFEAAVREANVRSVMNAYHDLDGVPCGASRWLLTDLLRGEWGFDGIVVSDYMAINQLAAWHKLAADKADAALLALDAGMDIELPSTDCFGAPLVDAVRSGVVAESAIDAAVARVLTMKFELGLFEQPYVDEGKVLEVFDTPDQRRLARTLAEKSMVLLKNAEGALPLSRDLKSIAVIGPNADSVRHLLGDYSYPAHIDILVQSHGQGVSETPLPDSLELADTFVPIISVLQAIRDKVGPDVAVHYAQGCDVLGDRRDGFNAAVEAAQAAEVAVVVVGDKSGLTLDCSTGEFRDRATLGLPGVQEELVRAIIATGTPVIMVLVNGRPFALPELVEQAAAVLEAWLPGEEGAAAIADVLFGDVNPGGKLPVTVPRSVGQVPIYYGQRPSGGRSFLYGPYVDESNEPLFPFGFGLSYTTFTLDDLHISVSEVTPSDTVEVQVRVRNTGSRAGDEVVQLYTRTNGASVTRPVKELRGFARVSLSPGETKTVTFRLPVAMLNYYDLQMRRVVEPGQIEVMVGTSARDIAASGVFTITGPTVEIGLDAPRASAVHVS